jgi:alkylation response protein AidB-like acyl-CoA dehydrogenase
MPATDFYQDGPRLSNTFTADPVLRSALARLLPGDALAELAPPLERLGARAATELPALAEQAERELPRHVPFDAWGRRVDRLELSPAWTALRRIAAEEGIVAEGYERGRWGEHARLVQMALLYLYAPASATQSCPFAMTDGAARLIEALDDAELRERTLPRLLARDPASLWTSGQWMTERGGGSDVGGGTGTVAVPDANAGGRADRYLLHGTKWFTSAIDADIAFTLAREEGGPPGSRGLALFYLELRDAAGSLRGIRVLRLKDKLGTKALPTAELELAGAPARRLGAVGEGVRQIALLMNVTRVWNACCAAGGMARGLQLARDYAARRRAFGRPLAELPAHRDTLAGLAAEHAGGLLLVLEAARLWGLDELGRASPAERATLRLLTPLVKLFTAKQAVAHASEALECMGGAGYVEDTGLPRLLRDAQVLPIWEGTTNVLALDALRAIQREQALEPLVEAAGARLRSAEGHPALAPAVARVTAALGALRGAAHASGEIAARALEAAARPFALGLARTTAAALALEQAAWSLAREPGPEAARMTALARRFTFAKSLAPIGLAGAHANEAIADADAILAP